MRAYPAIPLHSVMADTTVSLRCRHVAHIRHPFRFRLRNKRSIGEVTQQFPRRPFSAQLAPAAFDDIERFYIRLDDIRRSDTSALLSLSKLEKLNLSST